MKLTRTNAVSAELPWCYFCAEIKVLGMTWKSTEIIFGIYKNTGEIIMARGPTPCPRGWGARPLPRGPPDAPPTSTPTPYIPFHGEKNQRGSFIALYDMEPPPSPKTPQKG